MRATTARQRRVTDTVEHRAASAKKLASPRWPSFMASPTLHHPVGESKSDLVSTSRADIITQIVEPPSLGSQRQKERRSAGSPKLWRKRPEHCLRWSADGWHRRAHMRGCETKGSIEKEIKAKAYD
jgi:hypothetical protein